MTEETHRRWDIIFKWLGLAGVLASAWWTVHSYNQNRALQLAQEKDAQQKDEEARTKDQNSLIFQHQATLYFETARTVATIATAIDPKKLKDARERFDELYYGELVMVEDRRVELATIAFQECLLKEGVECTRAIVPEYESAVDILQLNAQVKPTLQSLSLEIGACIRTALQEGRKIQFGQVKSAITDCPYK